MSQDRAEELKNAPGCQKEEEEKPKSFSVGTGNILDDLDDWASKLKKLGEAVAFLGGSDEGEGLILCGEGLGMIIEDYAEAIESALGDKETRKIFHHKGSELFSLSNHQETYEMIRQGAFHPETALIRVDKEIEEVDCFLKDIAGKTYDLRSNLKELRKAIIERIEQGKVSSIEKAKAAGGGTK